MYWTWLSILFLFFSCENPSSEKFLLPYSWQIITSRDEENPSERKPLYRAKVPTYWIRQDPLPTTSIADTTKPLCEFYIEEEGQHIHLTIHNFPEQRIPPMAQINRWLQQFEERKPTHTSISALSHGGFAGLLLEAEGIFKAKPAKVLGWSMQLASEFYQQLEKTQKKADYTIKAVGPPDLVNQHRESIGVFADSFELIDELPSP